MDIPKYQIIIREYLNGGCKKFELLKKIGNKTSIMRYLKRYKEVFPNRSKEIDYVIDNYDILFARYKYEIEKPIYIKLIDECISGDKEAFKALRRFGTKDLVIRYLNNYKKVYPNKSLEIEAVKQRIYDLDYLSTPKYIRVIDDFVNGISDSFLDIYLLGDKTLILKYLKKYVNKYPENSDKISYIVENIDGFMTFKSSESDLKKIFEAKMKNNPPKYIIELNDILFLSEDEALHVLTKKNISAELLGKYIKAFKTYFPLQEDEIKKLNSIQKNLKEKNGIKQTSYINKDLISNTVEEVRNKDLIILNDLINSNLSIEEFCSKTGCLISTVRLICERYKDNNEEIIDSILKKDTKEFKCYIKEIGECILLNNEFNKLDYYLSTSLRYEDFRNILFEVIPKEEVLKILRRCTNIFKISTNYISKEKELEIVNTINGRVISKEDKIKVFDFLDENNMPIDLYRLVLKKYVNGEIDLGRQKRKY